MTMSEANTQRVVVIGAGGHARVCIEALRSNPDYELVGAVSRDGSGVGGLDIALLGVDSDLTYITLSSDATTGFVAIGDNAARARMAAECDRVDLPLAQAISRHAAISPTAQLDDGVAVLPGAVINAAATIGRAAIVNTNASVDHDCRVGAFVHIAPGSAIGGGVTIGDRAMVGIGATVLPGVSIGADAVVGAGAVVIRDVPDGAVVVGNPAGPLRGATP